MATKERNRRYLKIHLKELFKKDKPQKSDKDINKKVKVLDNNGKTIKVIKNE